MKNVMLFCAIFVAVTMLFVSAADAGGGANYYRQTKVNIIKVVYQCEGELIGVDYLGGDLYLAAFIVRPTNKVPDLHMVVYNAKSDSVVNTELLSDAWSYSISGDLKSGVVGVLYSYEGSANTWLLDSLGETVMVLPGLDYIVAGPNLMGLRRFSPKSMNTELTDGAISGHALQRPGPFETCVWDLMNSVFRIPYLSNELVVIKTYDDDGRGQSTLSAYDTFCTEIWQYTRTTLNFAGSGELGGEPHAVVTGIGGAELVSMKTGAAHPLCAAGAHHPTFGDESMFFYGRLDNATEFSINRLTSPAGKPEPIVAARDNKLPNVLCVQRGVLYSEFYCGNQCVETAIFTPNFSDAKLLSGHWRSAGPQVLPERVIGGLSGKGTLNLAVIED